MFSNTSIFAPRIYIPPRGASRIVLPLPLCWCCYYFEANPSIGPPSSQWRAFNGIGGSRNGPEILVRLPDGTFPLTLWHVSLRIALFRHALPSSEHVLIRHMRSLWVAEPYDVLHVAADAEATSRGGMAERGVGGAKTRCRFSDEYDVFLLLSFAGSTPIKSLNIRLDRAT